MKLHNSFFVCAALGLAITAYAGTTKTPAVSAPPQIHYQAVPNHVASKKTLKAEKQALQEAKEVAKLDLNAVNNAPPADLEKAVGKKAAKRIVTERTKGGKFTDAKDLCKSAKIHKKLLKKLVVAFPKA